MEPPHELCHKKQEVELDKAYRDKNRRLFSSFVTHRAITVLQVCSRNSRRAELSLDQRKRLFLLAFNRDIANVRKIFTHGEIFGALMRFKPLLGGTVIGKPAG